MQKPLHYKNMKIDVIEFCQENDIPFDVGNVIKYVCRYKQKNGIEDLYKAKEYLERMIEYLNKQNLDKI